VFLIFFLIISFILYIINNQIYSILITIDLFKMNPMMNQALGNYPTYPNYID